MPAEKVTLSRFYKDFTTFKNNVSDSFNKIDRRFNGVDKKFERVDERFEGIDGKLAIHTAALLNIESKLNVYGDMYHMNKAGIEKLDRRVTSLEDR